MNLTTSFEINPYFALFIALVISFMLFYLVYITYKDTVSD
jgi:hypothetical protein